MGSVVEARRLQRVGSVVAAQGPSCSKARGILLDQRVILCPPHCRRIPIHCATQESPTLYLSTFALLCSCLESKYTTGEQPQQRCQESNEKPEGTARNTRGKPEKVGVREVMAGQFSRSREWSVMSEATERSRKMRVLLKKGY